MVNDKRERVKRTEAEANAALDRIGEALREQGVTLDELIASGREIRGKIAREKYGIADTPTLAAGYGSIPALDSPKSDEEIAAAVANERAARHREPGGDV